MTTSTPLVAPGYRVTAAVWSRAVTAVHRNGRVLLRTKANTNQATTAAAKLNNGAAPLHGLRAYTEALEDGSVGIWLALAAPDLEADIYG